MPADPIHLSALALDLSPRLQRSGTVAGSPAAAAETIIASLTIAGDLAVSRGIFLFGYAAYTVGTSGTAVQFRLRQTDLAGTVVKASGALTRTAANLYADTILGLDTAPVMPGQVYVLTMIVTAGAAASTVSAVELIAIVS